MAKKSKKKFHPVPALGWVDKLIYYTAMAVVLLFAILTLVLYSHLRESIAYCDPDVIASMNGIGYAQFIWMIFWFITAFVLICVPYGKKQPIFGKKGVKYGPPAYLPVYPLFMKNKPYKWVSEREVKRKKKAKTISALALILTFLFSCGMFTLSLSGRAVLNNDGTITVYNAINKETEHYKKSDITSVSLETHKYYSRYSNYWTIRYVMNTEDKKFEYAIGSFKGADQEQLQNMLYVKEELYPNLITISGSENLQKVFRDQNLSAEEQKQVYELFELTQQ